MNYMFDVKNPLSRNLHDEGAVKFANRMICFDEKETTANDSNKTDGVGSKTGEGDERATEAFDKHVQDNAVTGNVVPDSGKDVWQQAGERAAKKQATEEANKEAEKQAIADNIKANTSAGAEQTQDDKSDDKKATDKTAHLPDDPDKLKEIIQNMRKDKSQGSINFSDEDVELFGGADEAEQIADVLKAGNLSQKQADAVLGELRGMYNKAANDNISNENGAYVEQRKILNEVYGLKAGENIDQATRFAERMADGNKEQLATAKAIMNSAAGVQFIYGMMNKLSNTVPNIAALGAPAAPSNIFANDIEMYKAMGKAKDNKTYNTDTDLHAKIAATHAYNKQLKKGSM